MHTIEIKNADGIVVGTYQIDGSLFAGYTSELDDIQFDVAENMQDWVLTTIAKG